MSERQLLALAQRGDPHAHDRLIRSMARLAYSIANEYYAQGGDRDDLDQEAMFGLSKAVKDYRPGGAPFSAFAAMCIRRQVITAVKTASRHKHSPLNLAVSMEAPLGDEDGGTVADLLGCDDDPVERIALRDEFADLMERVDALSDLERAAVTGVVIEDRSYDEVADRLGCDPKAVDNAVQRARRSLRQPAAAKSPRAPKRIWTPDVEYWRRRGIRKPEFVHRAVWLRSKGASYSVIAKRLSLALPTVTGYVALASPRLHASPEIRRRGGRNQWSGSKLTPVQCRALHKLHVEQGLSVSELARRIWETRGFGSVMSAKEAIRRGWKHLDLPIQTIGSCEGTTRKGACQRHALVGRRFCWAHTPENKETMARHAAIMRAD